MSIYQFKKIVHFLTKDEFIRIDEASTIFLDGSVTFEQLHMLVKELCGWILNSLLHLLFMVVPQN